MKFRGDVGLGLRAELYHKRFNDVAGRTRHFIGIVEESGGSQLEMQSLPAADDLNASRIGRRSGTISPRTAVVPAVTAVMLAALAVPTTVASSPIVSSERRRTKSLRRVCGRALVSKCGGERLHVWRRIK